MNRSLDFARDDKGKSIRDDNRKFYDIKVVSKVGFREDGAELVKEEVHGRIS
jgi:hypothetical protein